MPDLSLQIEIKVGSVLTDADVIPVLSDADAVFGVRREDTGAVVVAAGTAMTRASTGLYTYSVANPVAGVEYTYVAKCIVDGATTYIEKSVTAIGGSATGYYANYLDLYNVWGKQNIAIWSQLDNDIATADFTRIQVALNRADSNINDFFRGGPYDVPLPVISTTTNWAAILAGAWLAKSRPHGKDSPIQWVFDMEDECRCEMSKFKAGILRLDDSTPGPSRLPQVPQTVIV